MTQSICNGLLIGEILFTGCTSIRGLSFLAVNRKTKLTMDIFHAK